MNRIPGARTIRTRQCTAAGHPGLAHSGPGRSEEGDEAFSNLVRRHRAVLLRRCMSRLGNAEDAEDALQDALLKAYRGAAGFEGRAAMGTWLFAIVENECTSLARRRRRHRPSYGVCKMIRAHEAALRRDADVDTSDLTFALEHLPVQARQVLALRFFRGASLEETSRAMGVGLSAAKMRLYRAIDQLRRHYPGMRVGRSPDIVDAGPGGST